MKTTIRKTALQLLFASALVAAGLGNAAAQAGISKNEIVFGQSMDLSGPASPRQKLVKEAADAYIKHINAKGGVNGRKIRLISLDNKGGKDETVANVKQLVEKDKVFGLFLVSGTSNVAAILPYLSERKMPLFGITTGSVSLRKPHPYLFHYKASYADEAARIAEQLAATAQSKVGIIYLKNGFGKEGLEAVESALVARKIQAVAKVEVAEDAPDYNAAAKTIFDAKPQAIILVSVSGPAPKIVQAYRALDESAALYGLSILSSDALYQSLGEKVRGMIITQTVPYPWDRTIKISAEYQDVMKATGMKEISVAGMEGFVAARMLVDALKTAGKAPTTESFTKVLENTGEQDLGGLRYHFTANDHAATHYVDITLIGKGGKLLR
jgi:ABC-type branched-subunit amino acid transport system substrate-binding protein